MHGNPWLVRTAKSSHVLSVKMRLFLINHLKMKLYHSWESLFSKVKTYDVIHCPKRDRSQTTSPPLATHSNKQKHQFLLLLHAYG